MRIKFLFLIIVLLFSNLYANSYTIMLDFINSTFVEKNINNALKYTDNKVVFRDNGNGSGIKELKKIDNNVKFNIISISFFNKDNFRMIGKTVYLEYSVLNGKHRFKLPFNFKKYLTKTSKGFFIVLHLKTKSKEDDIVLLFVFDKINSEYKLVFFTDPV